MCNCWIGIINEYGYKTDLFINTIKDQLNLKADYSNGMGFFSRIKNVVPKDYIDKRKNLSRLFNFCPLCGEKINWNKIRKEL